ncbi:MAG: MFS transporter [Leptospiraceae bacterium]|nr:MFS transporter [Leptospiraceae bacterium]
MDTKTNDEKESIKIIVNNTKLKFMLFFYLILFFFFLGLGANLSSISPYLISNFNEDSEWLFIINQVSVPVGTLFAGWISDKTKLIRPFLIIGLLLNFPAQYLFYSFPENSLYTGICIAILRLLLSANYQWIVIGAIESLGENSFSKIRSYGTIGFLFAQLILFLASTETLSLLKSSSESGKFGSLFYLIPLLFIGHVPRVRNSTRIFLFKDALKLLKQKHMLVFFFLSFLFYSAYQSTDNYQGRYFQLLFGLQSVYMMWFIGVIFEVPFLLGVPQIVHKLGIFSLVYLSIFSGILKFFYLSISPFRFDMFEAYFFQMFHSILFAGYYMAGIYWFRKTSEPHLYGSIYGLYSIFAISLGGVTGNLICGNLLHSDLGNKVFSEFSGKISPVILSFIPIYIYSGMIYLILLPLFYMFFKLLPGKIKKSFH